MILFVTSLTNELIFTKIWPQSIQVNYIIECEIYNEVFFDFRF